MGSYNRRINRLIISFSLGMPSYAIFALIRNFPFSQITSYAFVDYGLTASVALFLVFEVQNIKSNYLDNKIAWENLPRLRLVTEVTSSFIITSVIVIASYSFLYIVIWKTKLFYPSIFLYVTLVYFLSLCFMVFVNAAPLISSWKSSILKAEILEKQTVEAKLEALRVQLSPHFFFNNLSILNGLVEKYPHKAKGFISKLSGVFRYILKHKNDEIVPLSEEIDFIKDYMFLIKSRFEEKVIYEIDIPKTNKLFIPPVTLQQLIENAVKHNESSYNKPLLINISLEEGRLVVTNNLQKIKGEIPSAGTGLHNIRERFKMLSDEPINISERNGKYQVILPLIRYNEGSMQSEKVTTI